MKEKIEEWERAIKPRDSVLDIGCCTGGRVYKLSKKTKKVYGMDIDTAKFELAPKQIRNRLFFGDVTKEIPFKRKFDWIFLTEVLEHLEDDEAALRNINKSLKVGGKLVLTTPRSLKCFEFWDPAWIKWKLTGKGRHYHYTQEELFDKLSRAGFKIEEYYIRGDILWVLFRWVNVFLKYGLKSKRQINWPMGKGFCDWVILAKKVKELRQ